MSVPAAAADIKVVPRPSGAVVIMLAGEIVDTDGQRFAEAASNRDKALVMFSSPGGNLLAGLRIGQFIRLHNFSTLVPDGEHCASACALAWLGGTQRFMEPKALIGFHAAYTRDSGGRAQVSGQGNALVGAYLSRLGLNDDAILYIEQSRPEDITWLTERAARTYGISLNTMPSRQDDSPAMPFKPPADSPPQSATPPKPATPPAVVPAAPPVPIAQNGEEAAKLFAATYFSHWSETNTDALGYFTRVYSPHVTFYGTAIDRNVVIDQKRKFAERWPERMYAVRDGTMRSRCEGSVCAVAGVVAWDARTGDRGGRTTGTANFRLDLAMEGGRPRIVAETGSVISRGDAEAAPSAGNEKQTLKETTSAPNSP